MRKTHYEKTIIALALLCGITAVAFGQMSLTVGTIHKYGNEGVEPDMRNPNPMGAGSILIKGDCNTLRPMAYSTFDAQKGRVWESVECPECVIECYREDGTRVPCRCYKLVKYGVAA